MDSNAKHVATVVRVNLGKWAVVVNGATISTHVYMGHANEAADKHNADGETDCALVSCGVKRISQRCYHCGKRTTSRTGYCRRCMNERKSMQSFADSQGWRVVVRIGRPCYVENATGSVIGEGDTSIAALRQAKALCA